MVMANYLKGKPLMQRYLPATSYNAGDIIVIGDHPFVAHADNPLSNTGMTVPGGPSVILDALACTGGIYQILADAAYPVGTYVYWDPTNQRVTAQSGGQCVPFGWVVGGALDRLDDGGPSGAGQLASVLHDPSDDSGLVYLTGATANDNITNTGSETAFATTVTIPSGTLVVGDTIHVRASGIVNAQNSTNTNQIKVKALTAPNTNTTISNTGAINAAANAVFIVDFDMVFTAVGASGSFYVTGDQAFGAQGTATRSVFGVTATAINTNEGIQFTVTDLQSAASTGNNCQLLELVVQKIRK